MRITKITLLATVAVFAFSLAALGASFDGVIMDSGCAKMGNHYHMEKMHPKMFAHPNHKLTGKEARMCTLGCVKNGGHFVLYNPSTKKIYRLDPENDARAYAAERVRVTGTLSGDTIHIRKIAKRIM